MKPLQKLVVVMLALLSAAAPGRAQDKRPTAMKLLPAETVLLIRTADATLLGERLAATGGGKMLSDPELQGLVSAAGEEITSAYNDRLRDTLGIELNDLRQLPAGELAFALVERPGRPPAVAAIADFGDRTDQAADLIKRLQEFVAERGGTLGEQTLRNDTATLVRRGNDQNRVLALVQRESTFVIATDRDLLQSLLDRWDGVSIGDAKSKDSAGDAQDADSSATLFAEPLTNKPSFGTALRECLPGREEPPQAIFYADPIGLIRATIGRQTPVRLAMAAFPALGLDGVQGVGGAMWLATDKWDSLARGHLLLDNPRVGVMKIARFEPAGLDPPPLVPAGIENLVALHADPERMLNEIERLVDRFRYEGSLQKDIDKNLSKPLGIDFRKEVLANLEGHAYLLTGYDEGQTNANGRVAIALRQSDAEQARRTLTKIAEKFPDAMRRTSRGADAYYTLGRQRDSGDPPPSQPTMALGLISDFLVVATSEPLYGRCLDASQGVEDRYAESLQHRLIAGRLKRLAGGTPPSILHYHNPEPGLRMWHALIQRDASREWLRGMAEESPFFRAIHNTLDRESLPAIDTLLKHNAPSGSVVYDTPTGFHLISFTFKRSGNR